MRSITRVISGDLFLLVLLALISYALSGCSKEPASEEAGVEQSVDGAENPGAEETVGGIEINGVRITRETIQEIAAPYLARIDTYAATQPEAWIKTQKQDVSFKILRKIIIEELLRQEAERQGIEVSSEEVDEKIEELASALESPLTVAEYLADAEAGGKSLADVREEARSGAAVDQLFRLEFAGKLDVTGADAQAYYDAKPDEFVIPENILVRHILIQPAAGEDPNKARNEARALIEDLQEQLKQGADFAELATAHSTCESRSRGGSLGYVKEGLLSPAFDEAAFVLRVDEVSEIVEASYGFHIIRVEEYNQEDVFTFDAVRDKIIEQLVETKRLEATRKFIFRLEEAAVIDDYSAEIKSLIL